jgi:hypothetical protein
MRADEYSYSPEHQCFAWQGIQVLLMNDWRPLRIEGNFDKGAVTMGDQEGPVFILRWLHIPKKYDGFKWIEKRKKQVAAGQSSENPPQPVGFDKTSWIKNLAIRKESEKTVWWGYSEECKVLVEVILTNLTDPKKNEWFIHQALPKLKVTSKSDKSLWQIYSARFVIPEGFTLNRHRLGVGDIALEFIRKKNDKLVVRQVYPAKLALQRRSLPAWLRDEVFKRHRFFKELSGDSNLEIKTKKRGVKKFPFPLGWVIPNQCERMIKDDKSLDRLYIVDAEWRKKGNEINVESLITEMEKRVA